MYSRNYVRKYFKEPSFFTISRNPREYFNIYSIRICAGTVQVGLEDDHNKEVAAVK